MKLQDERIKLETAKLAKEKGFDIGVYGSYTEFHKTHKSDNPSFRTKKGEIEYDESFYFINNHSVADYSNENYTQYAAPTQALLARWLREKHGIQVYAVSGTLDGTPKYRDYVVHVCVAKSHDNAVGHVVQTAINDARDEEYQTYEEAMEVGLQEALKKI